MIRVGDLIHWRGGWGQGYGTVARISHTTVSLICSVVSDHGVRACDGYSGYHHATGISCHLRDITRIVHPSPLLSEEPLR